MKDNRAYKLFISFYNRTAPTTFYTPKRKHYSNESDAKDLNWIYNKLATDYLNRYRTAIIYDNRTGYPIDKFIHGNKAAL